VTESFPAISTGAPAHLSRSRLALADGRATTLHVASYPRDAMSLEVRVLSPAAPLEAWCADHGVEDAIVGGFFVHGSGRPTVPLGEVRTHGVARRHVPFDEPWAGLRGCVHIAAGDISLLTRDHLPAAPLGDLLQAGPLLIADGRRLDWSGEGFSAGSHQFDSDITDGRHPRAAIGLSEDTFHLVACDGRAHDDAGLTLEELADALLALGCTSALNLDGGGSTSLVCGGRLRNVPREQHGIALDGGRALATALVVRPLAA
jgi:hypothetical protein